MKKDNDSNMNCKLAELTEPFINIRTLKFKAQPTNAFFATVNRLLPTSDFCRARGNQIVVHSSDRNETVLGSSRKLPGSAEHLSVDLRMLESACY